MATYEHIVATLLPMGFLPTVVPELKTITIGGAATGIGIESSSFRYGFVHETILELTILTGGGTLVHCAKDNENKDLFFGFPNSYGTLGYAISVTIALQPVSNFVNLHHKKFDNLSLYFSAMEDYCRNNNVYQFIDGVIFSKKEAYITLGEFTETAGSTSDYTYMDIYFKSIRNKKQDCLSTLDYIWRWDTDWFWCSKHFGAQNPVLRKLYGKKRLRSTTYWKIRSFAARYGITSLLHKISRKKIEAVIQDVEIPINNCLEFMEFFTDKIGITPVWICPVKQLNPHLVYPLYKTDPDILYINFGFWDIIASDKPEGYYNKLIEEKVLELNGKKSLYSSSYFSKDNFWKIYDYDTYSSLKSKYDRLKYFPDLYSKTVKGSYG